MWLEYVSGTVDEPVISGQMTEIDASKLPERLLRAKSIIIVPGYVSHSHIVFSWYLLSLFSAASFSYGMAMARCQHDMSVVVAALRKRKVDVKFAIHPVAGRMPGICMWIGVFNTSCCVKTIKLKKYLTLLLTSPGHMNVLLAEANIPHQLVKEMVCVLDGLGK